MNPVDPGRLLSVLDGPWEIRPGFRLTRPVPRPDLRDADTSRWTPGALALRGLVLGGGTGGGPAALELSVREWPLSRPGSVLVSAVLVLCWPSGGMEAALFSGRILASRPDSPYDWLRGVVALYGFGGKEKRS